MRVTRTLFTRLMQPFHAGNGLDRKLVVVFLLINGLVFVNASLHDPRIGYDANEHLQYIGAFSQLRLVTPGDSNEFFSPPLPYVFPALWIALTGMSVTWASKLAQFLNVFLSIGLTWYLIRICQLISPNSSLKFGALVFLGILPVYYKTFSFVRGEPYVAFLAALILYQTLWMSIRGQFTTGSAILLGTAMGLCALARQWGVLLFPPVFLFLAWQWVRLPALRASITRTILVSLALLLVLSGWFYLSLQMRYGSITAFNLEPEARFSLSNQPPEFYSVLNPEILFTNPIRPNLKDQFLPIFYSELWGDYWGYFSVYGRDTRRPLYFNGFSIDELFSTEGRPDWLDTNYETAGAYLGRVNVVSLFPSAFLLVSFLAAILGVFRTPGTEPFIERRQEVLSLLLLAILSTLAGYFWFLIMYPIAGKGDTIKASYVLQIFPCLAILAGILLEQIKYRSLFLYRLILGGLGFVFIHNFWAMITNYRLDRLI